MTEKQIIKALEGLKYGAYNCLGCEYKITKGKNRCGISRCIIAQNALDLIKRQKAEIERLEQEADEYPVKVKCGNTVVYTKTLEDYDNLIGDISAEGIKEFAERILELFPSDKAFTTISKLTIKQILKEIVNPTKAEWKINCDGYYPYCSNCHNEPPGKVLTPFCPMCGKPMSNCKDFIKYINT